MRPLVGKINATNVEHDTSMVEFTIQFHNDLVDTIEHENFKKEALAEK